MVRVWRKRARLDDPFAAGGGRAWLIGAQDGGFPPLGEHDPGWMGGLWVPPVQALAGLWLGFEEEAGEEEEGDAGRVCATRPWWLPPADLFEAVPVVPRVVWESSLADGPAAGLRVVRLHRLPSEVPGALVTWLFHEEAGRARRLRFHLLLAGSLRPGWRTAAALAGGEPVAAGPGSMAGRWEPASLPDRRGTGEGLFLFRRAAGGWSVAVATAPAGQLAGAREPGGRVLPEEARDRSGLALLTGRLVLPAGGRARLRLAAVAGTGPEETLREAVHLLRAGPGRARRQQRAEESAVRARPTGDAAWLEEPWRWAREALRLLWLENQGGRGWAAGLPEFAWWFGADTAYTAAAAWPLGLGEEAARALDFLGRLARSAGGRVPHEVVQDGRVDHPGNTQETAQWVLALLGLVRATGGATLLRRQRSAIEAALGWLETRSRPGGLPTGYGMVEVEGLDAALVDSAAYAARAFQAAGALLAEWAAIPGVEEPERLRRLGRRWRRRGRELAEELRSRFAGPDGYADVVARPEEAVPLLRASLARAESDGAPRLAEAIRRLLEEALRPSGAGPGSPRAGDGPGAGTAGCLRLPLGHWVELVPYEVGLVPWSEGRRRLPALARRFATRWGAALNALDGRSAMTLPSGVLALALARYGFPDAALGVMEQVWQTAGIRTPGFPSEISPDAGCFVQAWTAYALVTPYVGGILGLEPDALRGRMLVAPRWPSGWHRMGVRELPLGDGRLTVELERYGFHERFRFVRQGSPLRVILRLVPPPGVEGGARPRRAAGGGQGDRQGRTGAPRRHRAGPGREEAWWWVSPPFQGAWEVAFRWERGA